MTPEGDLFRTGGSSRVALGGGACREGNIFVTKVDLSAVWSDSERMWSDGGINTDQELWISQWDAFSCMNTCQHLDENQFLTTTDAPCSFARSV